MNNIDRLITMYHMIIRRSFYVLNNLKKQRLHTKLYDLMPDAALRFSTYTN